MTTQTTNKIRHFHLLSVATGSVAHQIIGAAKSQFGDLHAEINTHAFVDTAEKIENIIRNISQDSLVFHALLDPNMKALTNQMCAARGIAAYDLTGNIMAFVADHTGYQPEYQPASTVDQDYYRRVDGLEFTLQHDDSRRLSTIHRADIVLLGISRVSKTPTSVYLGSLGFKVANISLATVVGLPAELEGSEGPVCALTIKPKRLQDIRVHRMQLNNLAGSIKAKTNDDPYTDLRSIVREVMEAERIYRDHGFPIVDVTDRTVEATAVTVLEALGLERPTF